MDINLYLRKLATVYYFKIYLILINIRIPGIAQYIVSFVLLLYTLVLDIFYVKF